ncbi:MAG: YeeE/YedE family protein [Hyphomicrobiaceae bacterium]|nr:YeeE/YedE family protein [Hyphomicrobiaceae bacterium]
MNQLHAIVLQNPAASLAIGGLLIGLVFGAMAQRTGFCTLGAISDWTLFGDKRRLRAWGLAIAIAVASAQALHAAEIVNLDGSLYRLGPMPLGGHILGGLLFGFGMVLTGGCVSRNLIRAGSGDLRALLSLLVVGVVVMVTLGGILGPVRVAFVNATSVAQPYTLTTAHGLMAGLLAAAALLVFCLADRTFLASPNHLSAGIVAGLCVAAGWALTGLAYDEFADMPVQAQSLTFVKPVADSMDWLKRATALGMPGFAVMAVAGTLLGAAIAAVASGTFHLSTFADTRDTLRNLAGSLLMGVGGVLALGCSIGQGITGLSTLAAGSIVAAAAIVAGVIAGLKASERYSILT